MTARDAWGQVAHNLRALADSIDSAIEPAQAAVPGREGASAAPPPRSSAPAAPRPDGEGSRLAAKRHLDTSGITKCPAHDREFKEGRFGPYCSGMSTDDVPDPDWYNDKGYCRVTPKSVGAWLRQHPNRPAPVAVVEDIDDVPF